jgi:hypothetical protein
VSKSANETKVIKACDEWTKSGAQVGIYAAFAAGAEWRRQHDLQAVDWVRENEAGDDGYICDRIERRIKEQV